MNMTPTITKMHLFKIFQDQVDRPQMVSLYSSTLRQRGKVTFNTQFGCCITVHPLV